MNTSLLLENLVARLGDQIWGMVAVPLFTMSYFLFAMASPRFVVVDNLVGGWWLVAGGCPKRAVEHETTNPRADKQKNRKEGKRSP